MSVVFLHGCLGFCVVVGCNNVTISQLFGLFEKVLSPVKTSTQMIVFQTMHTTLCSEKNTHSHFLSYLHEWCVDLNKNCQLQWIYLRNDRF